ncbi:MAG: ribosome maturation factor RimP [Casimicrobium sp.]
MSTNTKILISDVLFTNGYELIEAEFFAGRELWRVFIDRPESRRGVDLIDLNDCSAMSSKIEDALTAGGVPYEHLEVSSPGLDRALTKPEHFDRFAGEKVKLTIEPAFEGLRKLTGVLVGLDGDQITIDVDGVVNMIPYAHIARARVVPQY